MTDVYFYHLEQQPLDKVLPRMLVQTLDRGWRAVIQAGSEERCEALSSLLWTFEEQAFVPHGTAADGHAALQPIWLTPADENPNRANVRFFVDGARPASVEGLDRAVILFDGGDEAAVTASREDWKRFKADGHAISYWQQDEDGRWQNRAGG